MTVVQLVPSETRSFRIEPADLKLLSEIGMSAAAHGYGDSARPIFDALAAYRPRNAAAWIGYALIELAQGKFDQAITILSGDQVIGKTCEKEAKGMLLVALYLANRREEARRVHRELLSAPDSQSRQIAKMMLERVTEFAAKAPTSAAGAA